MDISSYCKTTTIIDKNGDAQLFDPSKIFKKLEYLSKYPTSLGINPMWVAPNISNLMDLKTTEEVNSYLSSKASNLGHIHPEFLTLASRLLISNHQKRTPDCFSEVIKVAYNDGKNSLISRKLFKFVQFHRDKLNNITDYTYDFRFKLFGFSTLMKNYLLRFHNETPIETPQDMFMRVSCSMFMNELNHMDESVLDNISVMYNLLANGYISLASPTLFNAGTKKQQLLSCFLCAGDDSTEGITDLNRRVSVISKHSGGVGFWMDLRGSGEPVRGINGKASGPIPMLAIMQASALAFDQGGKRPGSFASYMSPHHPDIMDWIKARRPGNHLDKLFYGLWISDKFMKSVENDLDWYTFCPNKCPELYNSYGERFEKLYDIAVKENEFSHIYKARDVWKEILTTQKQSGMPYMLYADTCNRTSNQKNLGMIKSSNLCAEIIEFSGRPNGTGENESGCCVLGTMCLPKYYQAGKVNYTKLADDSGVMCRILNQMIDRNFYPTEETKRSNMRNRPISIGVQGLADLFMIMKIPFTSEKAEEVNRKCMEYIYYGALRESVNLAKKYGRYKTYEGSDFSNGILAFHNYDNAILSEELDWDSLIEDVEEYGTRNSLLTGLPPTASSSNIQGNNECFEPYTYIGYMRKTIAGEFYIGCDHFVNDCIERGIYSIELMKQLIDNGGDVQNLDIPQDMKEIYKTSWDIPKKQLIKLAMQRQWFLDQSQSLNQWVKNPTDDILTKIHFHTWKTGLKTGMYYLRMNSPGTKAGFGQNASSAVNKIKKREMKCDDGLCCSV